MGVLRASACEKNGRAPSSETWSRSGLPRAIRACRYVKAVAAAVAAYALSPIDLIPDFIPVLGYLDDVLIVPAGIWLTVCLIPTGLMVEFRAEASRRDGRPKSPVGAAAIVVLWLSALAVTGWWVYRSLPSPIGKCSALSSLVRSVLAARRFTLTIPFPGRGLDGDYLNLTAHTRAERRRTS